MCSTHVVRLTNDQSPTNSNENNEYRSMMDTQEYHGERNVSLLHDILYSNAFQEKAAGKYVVNISNEQRETLRRLPQILLCRYAEVDIQMVICMDYNPVNQHGNDGTLGITGRGIKCFGPGQDHFQFVIC